MQEDPAGDSDDVSHAAHDGRSRPEGKQRLGDLSGGSEEVA
jgi:hypothetical protein